MLKYGINDIRTFYQTDLREVSPLIKGRINMISLNWVKDYVDIENRDLKKLATEITQAGINVEK